MKLTFASTVLATIATSQLVSAQAGNVIPNLPDPVTDIYWWKSVVPSDQVQNYITGPAADTATIAVVETKPFTTEAVVIATTTTTNEDPTTTSVTVTPDAAPSTVATPAASVNTLSSAIIYSSGIEKVSGASEAPSVVAWSSSSYAYPSASSVAPRPSGSIAPPATSSVTTSGSAINVVDICKVAISVSAVIVLGNSIY